MWSSQSAINMHLPERYVPGIRRLFLERLRATSNIIKHRHKNEAQECFVVLVLLVLVVEL